MLNKVSIIIPAISGEPALEKILKDLNQLDSEIIVSTEGSRAKSLNAGVQKASRDYLWFLHADTDICSKNFLELEKLIASENIDLNYFDLAYTELGLARFNAFFANIRSSLFSLPYGDQGLFVCRNTFNKIGYFPDVDCGEDLLFIRVAKTKGVKIKRVASKLYTSARKYEKVGWLKLTILRQFQMYKLLLKKI